MICRLGLQRQLLRFFILLFLRFWQLFLFLLLFLFLHSSLFILWFLLLFDFHLVICLFLLLFRLRSQVCPNLSIFFESIVLTSLFFLCHIDILFQDVEVPLEFLFVCLVCIRNQTLKKLSTKRRFFVLLSIILLAFFHLFPLSSIFLFLLIQQRVLFVPLGSIGWWASLFIGFYFILFSFLLFLLSLLFVLIFFCF